MFAIGYVASFFLVKGATERSIMNSFEGNTRKEQLNNQASVFNNYAVIKNLQDGSIPSYIGADNGQAFFLFIENQQHTITHVKTSMPVFKVFGILPEKNHLLYSPLKNRIPSGELFVEDLESGIATKVTEDLILEAEASPNNPDEIAYTFATGEGFGLAIIDLDSKQRNELISDRVLPDFFHWKASGKEIYYFETTDELNTFGVVPRKVSVKSKKINLLSQDSLPQNFPILSTKSDSLDNASTEFSSNHSEIHYPFEITSPDKTKKVCGKNFFGNSSIQLCENINFSNQANLSEGQLVKVINQGVIVRSFEENRTTINFVDWNGNKANLAVSPQVSYNLPMSPSSGSFVVTRSGTGYSNACGLPGISPHTGALQQFAFDMQKQIAGHHVIASAEGLAINPIENINCNSCETSGCGGKPYCLPSQANGGWGNTVLIQHADTTWTRYSHLQADSVTVGNGDNVCQGLYVGNQGGTGSSCGSFNGCGDHLHFQKQGSATGNSISASFSDVSSNPLSCSNYTTGSTEVSGCSTCRNGTSTLRNRDGGPPIHPPGSVIKTASSSTVYLIDSDNRKRPITSSNVLAQLYNQSTDARTNTNFTNWVITVGQDELDLYEQGGNISAALPANGKQFPDGKLIGYNGQVSIVTGVGKRRAFTSGQRFTQLGYDFCQVVNVSLSEYNSYLEGPFVDAMPLLTSSLNISPTGTYFVGQNITSSFTIKNVGYESIPFTSLGAGGRLNGNTIYDMNFISTTLTPGLSHTYTSQNRQLNSSGTYDFFAVYQENNGHWAVSVPAAPGVIRSRQIQVQNTTSCPSPSAITFGQTVTGTLQSGDCLINGKYYDAYTFNGIANQKVLIRLSSTQFDSYLFLYRGNYPSGTLWSKDDDGGGYPSARIPAYSGYLTLPSTGVYTILASSYPGGQIGSGSYSLSLSSGFTTQEGSSKVFCDFDSDGKTDYSIFRPSDGVWYFQSSSKNGFDAAQFGISTDKIVPADYDGDGRTDVAVYRDGTWYLQRSSLGFTGFTFGAATDIPMPADFDGDGKAELAVFRPSNGVWYMLNLENNQFGAFQFGQNGDKPVAADYDGDAKADIAVFRPSTGTWYLSRSALGFTGVAFGISTDKPVAADYDGDRKTDIAVARQSDGLTTWYILGSTKGFYGVQFGADTDKLVPGDYDGDAKADVAVWRPSNGTFYVMQSQEGFTGFQFGANGDLPAASSFVP